MPLSTFELQWIMNFVHFLNSDTFCSQMSLPLCEGQTLQWVSSKDAHTLQTSGQAAGRKGHCKICYSVQSVEEEGYYNNTELWTLC